MKIFETDNFNRDYPDEKFVNLPDLPEEDCKKLCSAINDCCSGEYEERYWKVVKNNYQLQGPFTP